MYLTDNEKSTLKKDYYQLESLVAESVDMDDLVNNINGEVISSSDNGDEICIEINVNVWSLYTTEDGTIMIGSSVELQDYERREPFYFDINELF